MDDRVTKRAQVIVDAWEMTLGALASPTASEVRRLMGIAPPAAAPAAGMIASALLGVDHQSRTYGMLSGGEKVRIAQENARVLASEVRRLRKELMGLVEDHERILRERAETHRRGLEAQRRRMQHTIDRFKSESSGRLDEITELQEQLITATRRLDASDEEIALLCAVLIDRQTQAKLATLMPTKVQDLLDRYSDTIPF